MNRLFWIMLVSGLGLVFGGFALLFTSGYDALNPGVWSVAWGIIKDSPMLLIDAAKSGEDANLFRGILFVFGGFAIVLSGSCVFMTMPWIGRVAGAVGGSLKAARNAPKKEKEAKSKAPSFFSSVKEKLTAKLSKDKVLDLEDEGEKLKKSSPRVVDIGSSASTKRVKVERHIKDEILEAVSGFFARVKSFTSRGDARQKLPESNDLGRLKKVAEFGVLNSWFEDVQKGSVDPVELVDRAKKICSEWGKDDFSEFASMDPINGAFVVRLVKSWADREIDNEPHFDDEGGEDSSDREKEREAIRAALRAMKNGESLAVEGEQEVDLDDESALESLEEISSELSEDDDDLEAMMEEAAEGMDEDQDDDLEAIMSEAAEGMEKGSIVAVDDEGAGKGEASDTEDEHVSDAQDDSTGFAEVLSEMRSFVFLLNSVESGDDEWPENLSDERSRDDYVTSLSSAFEVSTMVSDEDVLEIAERLRGDHEEFEWLLENPEIANDGFVEFVAGILEAKDASGDAEEEVDEEDEVPSGETSLTSYEETDSTLDSSALEQALAALDQGAENEEEGEEDPFNSDAEASQEEGDGEPETNTEVLEGTDQEGAASEGEDVSKVEETHEPRDLSIPVLSEISESRGIPIVWGKTCREAGATQASIGQLVFEKGDNSLEPIGLAHLVTLWKNHDATVRLNVVLKKVPEGEWSLRLTDGIRMENQMGDYVEVEKRFLDHKEIKSAKTIIHFYGPGVDEFESVQVGSDMVVVSKTFSVEEIREFIKK